MCGTLAALVMSIYIPSVAGLFRFEALAMRDLLLALAAGIASVLLVEIVKFFSARRVIQQ